MKQDGLIAHIQDHVLWNFASRHRLPFKELPRIVMGPGALSSAESDFVAADFDIALGVNPDDAFEVEVLQDVVSFVAVFSDMAWAVTPENMRGEPFWSIGPEPVDSVDDMVGWFGFHDRLLPIYFLPNLSQKSN